MPTNLDGLEAMIRKCRTFVQRAAPACVGPVLAAIQASASAGESPEGAGWAPRKGGGRALPDAASALAATAAGTSILVRLGFPYSLHNVGKGHAPQRRILPQGMTAAVADAIRETLIREWRNQ